MRVRHVVPVEVEIREAGAALASAIAAGFTTDTTDAKYENAYLCVGQSALFFVDRALDGLLHPSMNTAGIRYVKIDRIEVQTAEECEQTFCIVVKQMKLGNWAPANDRVFLRSTARTTLIARLQRVWSISHVQNAWTLPDHRDVEIQYNISWPKRVSERTKHALSESEVAKRQKDEHHLDSVEAGSGLSSAPENEEFEAIGDYLFYVPRAQDDEQPRDGSLPPYLSCQLLQRRSQHFNRVSYSSPQDEDSATSDPVSTDCTCASEHPVSKAWLLEIAKLPTTAVDHDSFSGNPALRLIAEDELRRITTGISQYELLDVPHAYIKKLNLGNDPAQWSCWEISARLWTVKPSLDGTPSDLRDRPTSRVNGDTSLDRSRVRHDVPYSSQPHVIQCRDVNIIAIRRMFIPPFMDTVQEFVLVMFSPTTATKQAKSSRSSNSTGCFDCQAAVVAYQSLLEVR